MTNVSDPYDGRWARRPVLRTRPIRSAGGFYRTAEGKGRAYGGVPLHAANDALVAAVRLAYKVAEDQVDRSTRLAQRLREAGDRAVGQRSDRQAMDALENLVMKTLMSGLAWWEASVAEGRCPVKRLAAAEYQMLGSMLGLGAAAGKKRSEREQTRSSTEPQDEPHSRSVPRGQSFRRELTIVHDGPPQHRRPVILHHWELMAAEAGEYPLVFHHSQSDVQQTIEGCFVHAPGSAARLRVTLTAQVPAGRWRAVICDQQGVQQGYVEVEI